jgi:flagella basal body P-ring formation protein FlgA
MLSLTLLLLSNVTVQLPSEATVQGSEMTLGQIATIQGTDPADVARVEGLALGYAPSPGYSRVVQRWKLVDTVEREFGDLTVTFEGQATCRVWPKTAIIASEDLRVEARHALEALFTGEDVQIRALGELHDETVPEGVQGRRLVAEPMRASLTTGADHSGSWSVPVQIVVDGMPYRTVWTAFEVDLFRVLPVLERDVAKGETIQPGDIVQKRTPVRSPAGFFPLSEGQLLGATANRFLSKDQPVGERDVTRLTAVKKGETIDLAVENRTILVHTKVTALQDGYVGDIVLVRVMNSGKELSVTVDRKDHVYLSLGDSN